MRAKPNRAPKTVPKIAPNIDHDRLFKELITRFFLEFLELFAPQIAAAIERDSIEFLDKELFAEFVPAAGFEADIIVRVKIAGEERFILIHIENQAKAQTEFRARMFDYYTLMRAKFGLRVYPIAVFSYDKPRRAEKNVYTETEFGMEVVRYQFQVIQLNRLHWQDFIGSTNPVATALMSKMNVAPGDQITVRREFFGLFTGKLDRKQLRIIDEFMGTYLKLSAQETQQLRKELETKMSTQAKTEYYVYMSDVEEEAFERGIEQGIAKGVAQGVAQGLREGEARILLRLLEMKLGTLGEELQGRIKGLATEQLEGLGTALLNFGTREELQTWLDANS